MDKLFGGFDTVVKNRRTTYQKVAENDNDECNIEPPVPPTVLGSGFLFSDSSLNKVRNRLNKDEDHETKAVETTQVLSRLYEDAEDLEKEVSSKAHNECLPSTSLKMSVQHKTERNLAKEGFADRAVKETHTTRQGEGSDRLRGTNWQASLDTETQPISDFVVDDLQTQTQILSSTNDNHDVNEVTNTPADKEDTDLIYPDRQESSEKETFQQTVDDIDRPAKLRINEIEDEWSKVVPLESKEYRANDRAPTLSKLFSKESFMRDFDDSSESNSQVADQEIGCVSSIGLTSELISESETPNSTDLKKSRSGALSAYQRELKQKAEAIEGVVMISESDEEEEPTTSHESKATVLKLKARLSKRLPPAESRPGKASLKTLMKSLKNSTKKQILDRQKEMIERQGLKVEDVEKEKEIVEDLLEQEIARNKRIRMKEKEKSEKGEDHAERNYENCSSYSDSDEDSVNEERIDNSDIKSDVSASDGAMTCLADEEGNSDGDEEVNSDGDEDSIKLSRSKIHKIPVLSDDEPEEESRSVLGSVINLGAYGDNLAGNSREASPAPVQEPTPQLSSEASQSQYNDMEREKFKIRAQKEKQRIKDMKESGVTNMFDVEAEESDDEWQGIGGLDGETVDDYDSELEKMIDDFSNTTSNADQIRQLLMAENKETDLKTVNKILYDLKNGGFRKARRNNFQLELSDDDDDELQNYKRRKLELMRRKRLQFGENDKKLLKNSKSKAFFESMVEDMIDSKNPFTKPNITSDADKERESSADDSSKHKSIISHEFVQQSLSFLSSSREISEFQASRDSETSEQNVDLNSLKQDSTLKALYASSAIESTKTELEESEVNINPVKSSYYSVVKSFGSNLDPDDKLKDGRKTVTVSKSYRSVGGSKTSITYLGKIRKLVAPKKAKPDVLTRSNISKMSGNRIFRNLESSFEN